MPTTSFPQLTLPPSPRVHRSSDQCNRGGTGNATVTLLSESADAQTDVPVDELFLEARVSIFSNAFAKTPSGEASLANVLRDIRDGRHAERIATIRATFRRVLDKTGDSKEAKKAIAEQKRLLQAFCVSGTAMSRTQRDGHSGLLQIDLDELGESLADVREIMKRDRHIAFGFISPSGDGLKLGLRINGNLHIESFAAAKSYFKDHYGKQIDPAVKDRLRLCFVSHDPDLWENSDAVVFDTESYPVEAPLLSKKSSKLSLIRLHSCNPALLHLCITRLMLCMGISWRRRQRRRHLRPSIRSWPKFIQT